MVRKFKRKCFLGIMVLVILFTIEWKTSDHISTSFYPTSTLMPLSHYSKLDVTDYSLRDCIEKELEGCREETYIKQLRMCIKDKFESCLSNPLNEGKTFHNRMKGWHLSCTTRYEKDIHIIGHCLLGHYERHFKKTCNYL